MPSGSTVNRVGKVMPGNGAVSHPRWMTAKLCWRREFEGMRDWSSWLAEGDVPEGLENLRRNVEKGLPCGPDKFIRKPEKKTGRALRFWPRGQPRNDPDE